MYSEEKKAISKEKILFGLIVLAIIIVIVILIIPQKEKQNITVVKGENITIKLYGDNPYYLAKGSKYEEPGYEAYAKNGAMVSYKIKVTGTVNSNTPGKYELVYEADNTIARRTVIVPDLEVVMMIDSEEYTNEEYNLMLLIKGTEYDKTILPNGEVSKDRGIEYEISDNGTYTFEVYDTYNHKTKYEKTITNFDKEGPSGICTNKLDLGKTVVDVEAKDSGIGVAIYIYVSGEKEISSEKTSYEFYGLYKDFNLILIYKLGNKSTIKCV